jgi:type IV pilus assembly protein PilB
LNIMVKFDFGKTPITQIADYIILYAAKSGASDIHFDPRENDMVVRIRVDGDLHDYTKIPKAYERNLTTRLKLLANMNITESRLPQDGAIKGNFSGLDLDMRVSSLPLNEGEKIVVRILDYSRSLEGIDKLGFNDENLVKLKRMMDVPNGIILVTGATGTGKSTTTYSILEALNKEETNIITVEDPIEMNIEGINQVQVNSEIGMTFAAALRSILRQDPNIILIGEIRDSETAKIAVRASITGHLVLSTIHTNNSLATIERLLDMDVERYLLSTALTGIISQRLAKRICDKCRIKRPTTKYEQKIFKAVMNKDVKELWDANPDGCPACNKGYKGRVAIHEVLEIDDNIRDALNNEKLEKEDLRKMVYTSNVITMLQDALGKVLDGQTNFEEVYRVIEIDSDDDENYSAELAEAWREERARKQKAIVAERAKNEAIKRAEQAKKDAAAAALKPKEVAPPTETEAEENNKDNKGINNLNGIKIVPPSATPVEDIIIKPILPNGAIIPKVESTLKPKCPK